MVQELTMVLPCPQQTTSMVWGDWIFAQSLAAGFEQRGVRVFYDFAERGALANFRKRFRSKAEVDLVIRGRRRFRPIKKRPYFIWLISHPDTVTEEELTGAMHIFVASRKFATELATRGFACSYLPQCTDGRFFGPHLQDDAFKSDVLFVGNRRPIAPRPVVDLALKANLDLQVWGGGWDDVLPPKNWKGQSIKNEKLGLHYASANVVLNDHTSNMLSHGFASNRVFDVLASGTPILTEDMDQMPDVVANYAHQYNKDTFDDVIARARSMPTAARMEASKSVLAFDTFNNRAETILQVMQE